MFLASFIAFSGSGVKAPDPNLISITSASTPSASFLDKMDEMISEVESTVAVTSRTAYIRLSAGARYSVWPMIAMRWSRTSCRNRSIPGWASKPGMLSSLSTVPPVCASPRPEIIGR